MKPLKFESLWVGLLYCFALLCLALWVRDIPHQYAVFSTTVEDIIRTSRMGDPKYFATAAMDIAKNGWISSNNDWVFNLWPPGFILLEALIIKTLGIDAPVILVLQILTTGLFSIVLTLLYKLLRENVDWRVSFLLPLTIFVFPVSRVFLLQPEGISLGESFAIGFFLIGILLALRSVQWGNLRYAAYAGIFFALAAYFRSQFEIILLAMTACGVMLAIVVRLKFLTMAFEPNLKTSVVKPIVVALLVAHAATLPWRAYHWIYQGSPQWVHTASVTFGNSVATSEELESKGGEFVVAGGGNLTCRIDPATCGDTANAKQLFIKTFLAHPVEWYSLKFYVIGKYWFSPTENWTSVVIKAKFMDYLLNFLLLTALVAVIALLFANKVRSHASWLLVLWFNLSLFLAYGLIFTVQQFEVRYFYFPKIMGVAMFLMLVSMYYRRVENPAV